MNKINRAGAIDAGNGASILMLGAIAFVPVRIFWEIGFDHAQPYAPAVLLAAAMLGFSLRLAHSLLSGRDGR